MEEEEEEDEDERNQSEGSSARLERVAKASPPTIIQVGDQRPLRFTFSPP